MQCRVGRKVAAAGLLAMAAAGGCNQTPAKARTAITLYKQGAYAQAAAELQPTTTKKDENYVLDNCRYGSCALAAGQLDNAQTAFLAAYQVLHTTNTNAGDRTMGAVVFFEGVKVWKGEPFEQAMAHYYLGLIFLIRHDYENARAAFQNSLFNLQDYAKKDDQEHIQEVQSNFALGYYGLGFCYLRLGNVDLARQNFQLAVKMDPSIQPVVTQTGDPSTNALLFIDAGQGPMRAGRGWYNEESAFGPTPAEAGPVPPVVAWVDGQQATMAAGGPAVAPGVYVPGGPAPVGPVYHSPYALVDTLAMAQQKRWQDIDTIRKTKAVVGTGLMAGGTGVAAYGAQKRDQGMMWAGIGAALLGGAVTASSQADLRYWEMLPRTVYVVPLTLPPGEHDIVVQAGPGRSAPVHVTIPGGAGPTGTSGGPRDTVLYFRLP